MKESIVSKDGVSYLGSFILITACFALWGFANDITNPMVKAFSKIFRMSVTDGTLVQVALPCLSGNIPIRLGCCWDSDCMHWEPCRFFQPN